MTVQPTPGPWLIATDVVDYGHGEITSLWKIVGTKGRQVAVLDDFRYPKEEVEANARLIAAAPEQHNANVKTLDFLLRLRKTEAVNEYAAHMVDELDALIEQNRSVIAKATGEAS